MQSEYAKLTAKNQRINIIGINSALLVIHSAFLITFWISHVDFMAIVNVFSVLIYLSMILVIAREKYVLFAVVTFLEIWVHMILATICLGWEYGFQYYCLALVPVTLYAMYAFLQKTMVKTRWILFFSVSIAMTFVFLRMYCLVCPPIYQNTPIISIICWTANVVITFGFLLLYMYGFSRTVMKYEKMLRSQAELDQLTGLYNRRKFDELINEKCERIKKDGSSCYVAIMDIDDFKKVNDTYGHLAGDAVLVGIANTIKIGDGISGAISRWGGEEFIVLVDDKRVNDTQARCLMQGIQQMLSAADYEYNGQKITVTVTLGMAVMSQEVDGQEAIRRADNNLYYGKTHGKNQCVFDHFSIM